MCTLKSTKTNDSILGFPVISVLTVDFRFLRSLQMPNFYPV
ncbi:hypothetical protein CLOSTMETH_02482 [[Clostridium] methylpentosum DSM 5476]|uniref:Uncharacterized protein n=1 Tax=[Clostridium] methylpentosum DSM 5476 TaxID=537013 RepID=C0EF43_9FIRM|nr:hypothetical protein CLOSTMETH_02482 [[Clostridium] methylpentosum DSM 5476]